MQKAAVRACRNAIEFNSLPAIRKLVRSLCMHSLRITLQQAAVDCQQSGACTWVPAAFSVASCAVTAQVPNGYNGLKLRVKIGVPDPVSGQQRRQ